MREAAPDKGQRALVVQASREVLGADAAHGQLRRGCVERSRIGYLAREGREEAALAFQADRGRGATGLRQARRQQAVARGKAGLQVDLHRAVNKALVKPTGQIGRDAIGRGEWRGAQAPQHARGRHGAKGAQHRHGAKSALGYRARHERAEPVHHFIRGAHRAHEGHTRGARLLRDGESGGEDIAAWMAARSHAARARVFQQAGVADHAVGKCGVLRAVAARAAEDQAGARGIVQCGTRDQ